PLSPSLSLLVARPPSSTLFPYTTLFRSLIGRTAPFPYWIPGRHAQHRETLELLLSGRTPSSGLEVEAQRRDGSRFTARMYVSPLRDPNGEQIGWMTSMTDITEPKRIREALTAAHERFMTVLE